MNEHIVRKNKSKHKQFIKNIKHRKFLKCCHGLHTTIKFKKYNIQAYKKLYYI